MTTSNQFLYPSCHDCIRKNWRCECGSKSGTIYSFDEKPDLITSAEDLKGLKCGKCIYIEYMNQNRIVLSELYKINKYPKRLIDSFLRFESIIIDILKLHISHDISDQNCPLCTWDYMHDHFPIKLNIPDRNIFAKNQEQFKNIMHTDISEIFITGKSMTCHINLFNDHYHYPLDDKVSLTKLKLKRPFDIEMISKYVEDQYNSKTSIKKLEEKYYEKYIPYFDKYICTFQDSYSRIRQQCVNNHPY